MKEVPSLLLVKLEKCAYALSEDESLQVVSCLCESNCKIHQLSYIHTLLDSNFLFLFVCPDGEKDKLVTQDKVLEEKENRGFLSLFRRSKKSAEKVCSISPCGSPGTAMKN